MKKTTKKSERYAIIANKSYGLRATESRIGAPAPRATLTGIVNVIDCTPEARATFEAAKQS